MSDTEHRKTLARRLLAAGLIRMPHEDRRRLWLFVRRTRISRDIQNEFEKRLSFGQRLADKVAESGGSWSFIIAFGCVLIAWVAANSVFLASNAFDPYPYIFLNLILSMVAALQAPVIMMSQNRQATKDRLMAEHDYAINLKAEIEIMALHDKLDGLRSSQIEELLKQQARQLELLLSLTGKLPPSRPLEAEDASGAKDSSASGKLLSTEPAPRSPPRHRRRT